MDQQKLTNLLASRQPSSAHGTSTNCFLMWFHVFPHSINAFPTCGLALLHFHHQLQSSSPSSTCPESSGVKNDICLATLLHIPENIQCFLPLPPLRMAGDFLASLLQIWVRQHPTPPAARAPIAALLRLSCMTLSRSEKEASSKAYGFQLLSSWLPSGRRRI